MSDPKKSGEHHITDLSAYADDVEAFEAYVKDHVRSKEDVEELLGEFDEQQWREWEKHLIDDKKE